jgi:hypothetical protein
MAQSDRCQSCESIGRSFNRSATSVPTPVLSSLRPSAAAPLIRFRVRYQESSCRAALRSARQLMTQLVTLPPLIVTLRKAYSITSAAVSSRLTAPPRRD